MMHLFHSDSKLEMVKHSVWMKACEYYDYFIGAEAEVADRYIIIRENRFFALGVMWKIVEEAQANLSKNKKVPTGDRHFIKLDIDIKEDAQIKLFRDKCIQIEKNLGVIKKKFSLDSSKHKEIGRIYNKIIDELHQIKKEINYLHNYHWQEKEYVKTYIHRALAILDIAATQLERNPKSSARAKPY